MKNVLVNGIAAIVTTGADEVSRVMMPGCKNTVYCNGQTNLDQVRLSGISSKRLPWRRLFFSVKK